MKKNTIVVIVIISSILLGALYGIYQKDREVGNEKAQGIQLIIQDQLIEDPQGAFIERGKVYLRVELVRRYFDGDLYIGKEGKRAYISLANKDFEMEKQELTSYLKDNDVQINIPLKNKNYIRYMPINLLEKVYGIDVSFKEDSQVVIIDRYTEKAAFTKIKHDNVKIHLKSTNLSRTLDKLNNGSQVKVLSENDNWYKVRTENGYYGYVEKKHTDEEIIESEYDNRINHVREEEIEKGKINITWEYVYEKTMDISDEDKIEGLDVLVPTWFSLSEEGKVINKADFRYVKNAQEKGYKVWGLVDNAFNPALTSQLLNDTEKKAKFIGELVFYSSLYNLDGINIDFENMYYEDKEAFVKFVDELTYLLKKQNLTVSIDVTVPSGSKRWSKVYDREKLAKIVDYVALMAYDEHWSTSPVSGSVASIGWVERGIKRSLEYIPKDKLILGIPFYTRVWKESKDEDGKLVVSSKAVPIKNVENIIDKYDAEVSWDEETGQYFATYQHEGDVYKIWIEDTQSIKLKLELADKYELSGIASWRKGYEYDEVWEVISRAVDKKDLL